jgi:hypothetical protein
LDFSPLYLGFLAFSVPDPAEVLPAAGLSTQALDDPENTIPYAAAARLLDLAAARTRCPHFGLEIGKQIRTTSLGLLGELVRNAPTVGVGLLDFATHQHRHANGGLAYLLKDRDLAFFGYVVYLPGVPGNHLVCDAAAKGAKLHSLDRIASH